MWLYGQGFPTSLDVSKAIDKAAGAERERIGDNPNARDTHGTNPISMQSSPDSKASGITAPATADAARWSGWGTALKPAWEPIIVARKPLCGTVAENVLAHGTGGLNIDGCRVGTEGPSINRWKDGAKPFGGGAGHPYEPTGPTSGRWPANLLHDGSEEVLAGFPDAGNGHWSYKPAKDGGIYKYGLKDMPDGGSDRTVASAARFFYCAKASKQDRDEGLDGLEPQPAGSLKSGDGGWAHEEERGRKARHAEQMRARNHHPTVKPTALMRYLCRLVTPPDGIVLDPFMGSGSTGKAARLEGFGFRGVELDPDYFAIAHKRILDAAPLFVRPQEAAP
jgi:site-specific DNA-methyltransferase (adenine-specific)